MQLLGTLQPTLPYDFTALIALLRRFPQPILDHAHDQSYRRVLRFGESSVLVQVELGSDDPHTLNVYLVASTGALEPVTVCATLARILSITAERSVFAQYAQTNPQLWQVVEPVIGLPNLCTQTWFEALCSAIIEQQISWRGALKAQRWLLEWGGQRLEYEGAYWYAAPLPQQIANATLGDLKPLKITDKRIHLLIEVARAVIAGALNLDALSAVEAYQRLTAIKGIGHWTAAVAISRALGYDGYVALNDVALQAAVNWYFYGLEGRLAAPAMAALFSELGEHGGRTANLVLSRWVIERY